MSKLRVLFFGDIIGKIGRHAVIETIKEYKQELKPDLIMANAENISHGAGITRDSLNELQEAGVDFFTSGNHVFKKREVTMILEDSKPVLVRPGNFPPGLPGKGYAKVQVGDNEMIVINLIGRVYFREAYDCPFRAFDQIYSELKAEYGPDNIPPIFVDFHAEATSEKRAFQEFVDGRVAIVVGTHTHVPTADTQVSAKGTAKVTDTGMVGAKDSIIGVETKGIIQNFMTQIPLEPHVIPEHGECQVNAIFAQVDTKTGKADKIKRVDKTVVI